MAGCDEESFIKTFGDHIEDSLEYVKREELIALVRDGDAFPTPLFRDEHDPSLEYASLDHVTKDGVQWDAKKHVPIGTPLVEGEYWAKIGSGVVHSNMLGAIKGAETDQSSLILAAVSQAEDNNEAIVNDFYQFRTESPIIIPKGVSVIRPNPEDIKIQIDSAASVVFVGDSLTELRNNDSYVLHAVDGLASHYLGYKDFGYMPFTGYMTQEFPISRAYSANMLFMWGASDGKFDLSPFSHSPDGKGMYTNNGDGADYLNVSLDKEIPFTTVRLYYLKQPGGGTFTAGFKNRAADRYLSIDTANATEALGFVDLDPGNELSLDLRIKEITGKVALYGAEFLNADATGFQYSVFARNGIKLKDFTALNAAATTSYFQNITPDLVVINLGTNDAFAGTSVLEYKADLTDYIDRILLGSPQSKIVLLNPNQPLYYYSSSTLYQEYDVARRELCTLYGWGYVDLPSRIGGYGELLGLNMMEDTVHPNPAGVKMIGNALVDYLKLNTLQVDTDYREEKIIPVSYHLVNNSGYFPVSDGVSASVLKFGMLNTYETVFVEVEIMAMNLANGCMKKATFNMLTYSNTPSGEIAEVRDVVQQAAVSIGASALYDIDISVTKNVNNECEIAITPSGFSVNTHAINLKVNGTLLKAPDSIIVIK